LSIGSQDGTHDIRIASDATASPTTAVDLRIAINPETNTKKWREYRRQSFVQRQGMGPIQFADKNPESDLVFSQEDWSGGALQPLYRDETPNKIAKSTGLDMRPEGVASLGMKLNVRNDFILRDGYAELGNTNAWSSVTGWSNTAITGAALNGTYGFQLVHGGSALGTGVDVFTQGISNHTVWRGKELTLYASVKRTAHSGATLRMVIEDSAGSTVSPDITNSDYTQISLTRTIDGSASSLRVGFESGTVAGAGSTWQIDDIFIIPTGGVTFKGVAEDGGALYGLFGRCICQWDETDDIWDAVYISSAAFNSIVQFDGNLYAAHLDGTAYVYGSTTSWTVSTITAPGQDANFFVVASGDGSVTMRLWKGILGSIDASNYGVYEAVDPLNSGSWGGVYKIGTVDTDITGMYHVTGNLVIGKEEGLFQFKTFFNDGTASNDFINLTLEYENNPTSENFAVGQESKGALYLSASQQALFRRDPSALTDISSLLQAPRADGDFGGRVRAMTNDASGLWLLVDTPTTDATNSKTTWLMQLKLAGNEFKVYTMQQISIGDIGGIEVHNNYLWLFGQIYNSDASKYESSIYRFNLPLKSKFPAFDAAPLINLTGDFTTSRWNGNLPDADKAFISCTLFHKATLDAEHTIVVKYGVNNADPTTTLGTANTGSTTQTTFYFNDVSTPESNAIGKDIQLNIAFATDDTVSPELYGFAVHSMLSPVRVVLRDFQVYIGNNIEMYNLQGDPTSKKTLIDNLETLESQVYPVYVTEDLDGDGTPTSGRWKILVDSVQKVEELDDDIEIWSLTMQKVVVS
jgi:hypothetical protein